VGAFVVVGLLSVVVGAGVVVFKSSAVVGDAAVVVMSFVVVESVMDVVVVVLTKHIGKYGKSLHGIDSLVVIPFVVEGGFVVVGKFSVVVFKSLAVVGDAAVVVMSFEVVKADSVDCAHNGKLGKIIHGINSVVVVCVVEMDISSAVNMKITRIQRMIYKIKVHE